MHLTDDRMVETKMMRSVTESQRSRILRYLESGRALTGLTALDRFGSFRLAARISELRYMGYRIDSTMIRVGAKRFASYRIIK